MQNSLYAAHNLISRDF